MDSYNQCAESTQKLIKLTQLLGWMINVEKSELNSTQIDIHNLLKDFAPLLVSPVTTPQHVMKVLGLMACTEKLIPCGRLHMQPLQ